MTFNVLIVVVLFSATSCKGHTLHYEQQSAQCYNGTTGYPLPVYGSVEEGERSGLQIAEDLYGTEIKELAIGRPQMDQILEHKRNEREKRRHKRAITSQKWLYWDGAYLPYRFDADVPPDEEHETRTAMKRHERFTCVRFVPWVQNVTRYEYNLSSESHVRLIKKQGCWSLLGNVHNPNGQKLSCCSRGACVHELSHAFGVYHDHVSPARHGFIRINWNNIKLDNWAIFMEEYQETTMFFRFDLTSIMHYALGGFKQGPWPSMTVLFKDLESLTNMRNNVFYNWQEISVTNQCKARMCPDFAIECINDGFVSYVEGACQCLCPPGLDPQTGCRTVIKSVASVPDWPPGSYGVLSTSDGCPSNEFLNRTYQPGVELTSPGASFHLGGNLTGLTFCLKYSTSEVTTWQTGAYAILAADSGDCPADFSMKNVSTPSFTLRLCQRNDGFIDDVLYLPTDTPFILFPLGKQGPCQSVNGMMGTLESLQIATRDTSLELESGVPFEKDNRGDLTMGFCYYSKYDRDCGDVIELSPDNPSTVVTSPGYPSPYRPSLDCHWLIKAPLGATMIINFEDFDVGKTGQCGGDSFIIRYIYPGQNAPTRCGQGLDRTFRTLNNTVTFRLNTDLSDHYRGFKAKIDVVLPENHCFNVADNGRSYRGRVNMTRDLQPCLPWDRVTGCPHHMFSPGDFDAVLEENFCRNPDNSFRPWCYTKTYEGQCDRNYCDVCGLENKYDNFPDCDQLKKEGLCEGDQIIAATRCAKTCDVKLVKDMSSSCSRPPPAADGLLRFEKNWYNVGETVLTMCPYGPDAVTRRCHSDGSWTPANYVCGVCPSGWSSFRSACYKFYPSRVTQSRATDVCSTNNAHLAWADDIPELEYIVTLRRKLWRMWLGASRESVTDVYTNTDGSKLTLTNWAQGAARIKEERICLVINPEERGNTIREESCNGVMPFVCKYLPNSRRACINQRWDCHAVLRRNPTVCRDYPEFVRHQCPFSCGFCQQFTTPFCKVTTPPMNAAPSSDVTYKYIPRGDVVTYTCIPGTVLVSGQLSRICEESGWLSGSEPVCVDENEQVTPVSQVDIIKRTFTCAVSTTYIGNNSLHRIQREGEITQWRFYTHGAGSTVLQIWRPRPDVGPLQFQFIGQNMVYYGPDRVNIVDIPRGNRIQVIPGDLIGIWSGHVASQIMWNSCGLEEGYPEGENSLILDKHMTTASFFEVDTVYNWKDLTCRTFSLTAYVNKTYEALSRTNEIPIIYGKHVIRVADRAYTGNNAYFRIRVNGSLEQWQLFSPNVSRIGLQVWRAVGENTYTFIGQNMITTVNNMSQVVDVQPSEQIRVTVGDLIGVSLTDKYGGASYTTCQTRNNPQALPMSWLNSENIEFQEGANVTFKAMKSCRIFHFTAVVRADT
ncbi:uncharacterized protein [Haliotis cracherodii]|uniref:uncharacterized protein n=1 Tax=Haliotis cracherodii TaxID=6455 RepID=UPI0039ED10D7